MQASEDLRIEDAVNATCPWSGEPIRADALTLYRDMVVGFSDPDHRDQFEIAVRHFETARQAVLHLREQGKAGASG